MGDRDPVIIGGARTGIGRLLGSLTSFSAAELGGFAIKGALDRAGVAPDSVEYVIMGHVLQAGAGPDHRPAGGGQRGIPMTTPATTVNKVCLSGLDAIAQAADLIRLGEFDVIVAGGMESMTNAPHVLKGSRQGYKYGPVEMLDSMAYDGLTDVFNGLSMGESTDLGNARARHLPRAAGRVRRPLAAARRPGPPRTACSPTRSSGSRSGPSGRRSSSRKTRGSAATPRVESLARLRPAFGADGTITAGTASQISDGAAAVVVTSRQKAEQLGRDHPGRGRRVRHRRGPGQRPALPAVERDQPGAGQGRPDRRGPRPDRDQRGVRRRRHRLHGRARRLARHRQRQRRRDRARPPARRVRHPDRAHARPASCAAAAAGSARRRSAAAAARARPCCCASR